MKKIALLLLMFVAFQVSAQDFHFLPKIGLNLANMTNSDGSMKPGLNVGVAAEFSYQSAIFRRAGNLLFHARSERIRRRNLRQNQKRLHKHSYLCKKPIYTMAFMHLRDHNSVS